MSIAALRDERPPITLLTRHDDRRSVDVVDAVGNPGGALYGGAALAASVDVAAAESGSRVRWGATRFLSAPTVGQQIELTARTDVAGFRTSHMTVRGLVSGQVAFETALVVGDADADAVGGRWRPMPDVPLPDDCPEVPLPAFLEGFAVDRSERRLDLGTHPMVSGGGDGPGRVATWVRMRDAPSTTPGALAWIADSVAIGIGQAVGSLTRATSLDNTIRYGAAATPDHEWVLVDVVAIAASDAYTYGDAHLYGAGGELLATGSQTCLVRTT